MMKRGHGLTHRWTQQYAEVNSLGLLEFYLSASKTSRQGSFDLCGAEVCTEEEAMDKTIQWPKEAQPKSR